ncbi:unnamed protein product [Calypogeia fissa]
MDVFGRNGGRGPPRYGPTLGGRGAGCFAAFSNGRSRGAEQAGFYTRGNPLWTDIMDHDQSHRPSQADGLNHWAREAGADRMHREQNSECKNALNKIAEITIEKWSEQEYVECNWDFEEAAYAVDKLGAHAMICYFTDRAPLLQDFRDWITFELGTQRGWPTTQIKFLGKNFFLVQFENPAHRDKALILAPWFMDHRFVYTFKWEANFDVCLETYTLLPVWIEIPFRCRRV